MARPDLRPLVVDVPLAVLIGIASTAVARLAGTAGHDSGFGPDGPPWGRRGPGGGPGFGRPTFEQPLAEPYTWAAAVWVSVLVLGIAFRRVRPRTGYAITVVGATGYLSAGLPFGPVLLGPALGLVAMATRMSPRQWAPWSGLLAPMIWAGFISEPVLGLTDGAFYNTLVLLGAAMVVPALFATLRRARIDAGRRTRELDLRRAAYQERLRIARDVHDLVGHSLSVINMQAGVALYVLDKQRAADGPDTAVHTVEESLRAIRSTSKSALDELRVTLAVFRGEVDDHRAPVAGLQRVPELVESFRVAGRSVELIMDDVSQLPGPIDAAAYRIVQEGLTNVARHAPDADATITIRRGPDRLVIDIVDNGPGGPIAVDRHGNGLIGMAERAGSVGGTVTAGPLPGAGFGVHAEFGDHGLGGAR